MVRHPFRHSFLTVAIPMLAWSWPHQAGAQERGDAQSLVGQGFEFFVDAADGSPRHWRMTFRRDTMVTTMLPGVEIPYTGRAVVRRGGGGRGGRGATSVVQSFSAEGSLSREDGGTLSFTATKDGPYGAQGSFIYVQDGETRTIAFTGTRPKP